MELSSGEESWAGEGVRSLERFRGVQFKEKIPLNGSHLAASLNLGHNWGLDAAGT